MVMKTNSENLTLRYFLQFTEKITRVVEIVHFGNLHVCFKCLFLVPFSKFSKPILKIEKMIARNTVLKCHLTTYFTIHPYVLHRKL